MIVNFRVHGISQGVCKLAGHSRLKKKNKRKKVVDNEIEWARKDQCPHIAET